MKAPVNGSQEQTSYCFNTVHHDFMTQTFLFGFEYSSDVTEVYKQSVQVWFNSQLQVVLVRLTHKMYLIQCKYAVVYQQRHTFDKELI